MDWTNKKILLTGACGTIGRGILVQLLKQDIRQVIVFDQNESEIFNLAEEYDDDSRLVAFVGNVVDQDAVNHASDGVEVILHSAALKHVNLGERYPNEIVRTNIVGMQNLIAAALENNVERMVFMSSDKAVNPTNVMGTSKLMGERLISAANFLRENSRTIFSSTRFGNVLGSRGSAVPLFMRQIKAGRPITLTDEDMSRFVMSCDQAVELVLRAATLSKGGEVFVTKMPVMRIVDMIEAVKRLYGPRCGRKAEDIPTKVVGKRPGEKLYEELLSAEEMGRAIELTDYFVVMSALHQDSSDGHQYGMESKPADSEYRSDLETPMSVDEIIEFFEDHRLIEDAESLVV